MDYVCDAPDGKTWFRLMDEMEADMESELMGHAVAKHFRRDQEKAAKSYTSASTVSFEQNIGLKAHLKHEMALFLTLRNMEGTALVTAMLPPRGEADRPFRCTIVGEKNTDPYTDHAAAIEALGSHFGLTLDRRDCFPYGR